MKRLALILLITATITTPVYAAPNYDEYRLYSSSQNRAVKVTDTDDLHIYSNKYGQKKKYTKFSYDEFRIDGMETESTDKTGGIDELHIPKPYRDQVWQPEEPIQRLGIDEIRTPADM